MMNTFEKPALYAALLGLSVFVIIRATTDMGTGTTHEQQLSHLLYQSYQLEQRLVGQTFPTLTSVDERLQEHPFAEVLASGDNIVLVTTAADCNACRDQELALWRDVVEARPGFPYQVLVTERAGFTRRGLAEAQATIAGFSPGAPLFFDKDGIVLQTFEIQAEETPLLVLLDEQGVVQAAHRAHWRFPGRSNTFAEIAQRLHPKAD